MRACSSTIYGLAAIAALTACAPAKTEAPPAEPATTATPAAASITLPVSINAIMVSLVDHASEPLWVDAYKAPQNADAWRETEYDAYQMAIAGKLIQLAGTGPNDADWVADPQWIKMSNELSAAGMDALQASLAQDTAALNTAGDRLVAACEACHKQFKPGLTSMGIYKSPNYPPKE